MGGDAGGEGVLLFFNGQLSSTLTLILILILTRTLNLTLTLTLTGMVCFVSDALTVAAAVYGDRTSTNL